MIRRGLRAAARRAYGGGLGVLLLLGLLKLPSFAALGALVHPLRTAPAPSSSRAAASAGALARRGWTLGRAALEQARAYRAAPAEAGRRPAAGDLCVVDSPPARRLRPARPPAPARRHHGHAPRPGRPRAGGAARARTGAQRGRPPLRPGRRRTRGALPPRVAPGTRHGAARGRAGRRRGRRRVGRRPAADGPGHRPRRPSPPRPRTPPGASGLRARASRPARAPGLRPRRRHRARPTARPSPAGRPATATPGPSRPPRALAALLAACAALSRVSSATATADVHHRVEVAQGEERSWPTCAPQGAPVRGEAPADPGTARSVPPPMPHGRPAHPHPPPSRPA